MNLIQGKEESGLVYESDITLGELVGKDTDGDGIPDWEEPLYGLNPNKKETTPGTPDSTAIAKMKMDQGKSLESTNKDENLTETDKFSRELFSTIATLNQNGTMNDQTIDGLSNSLVKQIQDSTSGKVYTYADINITNDNNLKTTIKYNDSLKSISPENPVKYSAKDVLEEFVSEKNNFDTRILSKLDPITNQTDKLIAGMLKITVPQYLAQAHLDFINNMEQVNSNLKDFKFFDSDPILALRGISKYGENSQSLEIANKNLIKIINDKLNN